MTTGWYVLIALAICIEIAGLNLCAKTTGKRYIGLVCVALGSYMLFYCMCVYMMPIYPSLQYVLYATYACIAVVGTYFVFVELFIIKDSIITAPAEVDYLIVHGAKVMGTTLSPSLQDRLDGTLEYLEKFPRCTAVLTGTKWPWAELSEAQCMYDWLVSHGISSNRLILEENAKNTVGNLLYSIYSIRAIEGENLPVMGILTSEYHMHRALCSAKRLGISVVGVPVKTKQFAIRLNYFIREAFAMTELYVFGVKNK